jgi:hypothetical protein
MRERAPAPAEAEPKPELARRESGFCLDSVALASQSNFDVHALVPPSHLGAVPPPPPVLRRRARPIPDRPVRLLPRPPLYFVFFCFNSASGSDSRKIKERARSQGYGRTYQPPVAEKPVIPVAVRPPACPRCFSRPHVTPHE